MVVEPTAHRRNLTASTYGWNHHQASATSRSGSFESFRSQWRKVHLCFREAFAHSRAPGGAPYDAFVRSRADMLHLVEYNLADDHRRMLARVQSLGRSGYVAMQACAAPFPMSVSDIWFVATPSAAFALAALPTPDEPPCCERWMEHRLLSMGTAEPPLGADAEHVSACRRVRTLPAIGVRSRSGPVFVLSRLHAIHLGGEVL